MPILKILSAPEVHVEGNIFSLAVDCNVYDDDGVELPGFHNIVLVPSAIALELEAQEGWDAALAYIITQIGAVDARYTPERIGAAVLAKRAKEALTAFVPAWPFEVAIPLPE